MTGKRTFTDWLFGRKPAAQTASPQTPTAPVVANPIVVASGQETSAAAASYRIEAILRDREQRAARKQPKRLDHDRLSGEALRLGGYLMEQGLWHQAQVADLIKRVGLG